MGATSGSDHEGPARKLKWGRNTVSKIKATIRFFHAWLRPDQIARDVEGELQFHIEMRTAANIESGMRPSQARDAAQQSFGDFHRIKNECCEISRSFSSDSMPLKMGLHIALAAFAGGVALWAVNVAHHSLVGVFRELVAIAILLSLFVIVRRASSKQRRVRGHSSDNFTAQPLGLRKNEFPVSDVPDGRHIAAHDEQGRTPLERMFESK